MTTSWSSLYLDWTAGMNDYISRHVANYSRIQTCLDYLYAISSGGGRALLDVPLGLQEIFDRNGIIGKASYKPPAGTLTGPSYNIIIPKGSIYYNSVFYAKSTSSTLSLSGYPTDTYYINIDAAGNPGLYATVANTAWQFHWDASTHIVSAVVRYAGCAILFDGDDYADALTSTAMSATYESIAERFEAVESALGGISDHLAYDEPNSTALEFHFKAGRVRNDNVVWSIVAGHVHLTNNEINYVEVNPADGVVSANIIGFTTLYVPLYEVTTAGSVITVVTDMRAWLGAGGGEGGGGGHAQNSDVGTTSSIFKLLMGVSGAPVDNAQFAVERGTSPDVAIRWNESSDKWEYTEDGSTWKVFGELDIDLGAQEISKYVPLENPALVLEELSRGSSSVYEEIDLSSYLTDAPDGVDAAIFRVVFWDTETPPVFTTNVRFRKGGIGTEPLFANTFYSPAEADWSRPQALIIGVSDDYKIEHFMTASGGDTASMRIYLLGYFKKILGVGTQSIQFVSSDKTVAADTTEDFDLVNFATRALVHYLKVEETGGLVTGDYDIEIYSNDTFDAAGLLYKAVGIHPGTVYEDWLPWMHIDGDNTKELHIRIINKDLTQTATFDIVIRCEMFA